METRTQQKFEKNHKTPKLWDWAQNEAYSYLNISQNEEN